MLVAALSASVSLAWPQTGHISWVNVIGRVLDGNGHQIHWGRVYVKDTHAHFLRIREVDRDGHFSVMGHDARLNYEDYAEHDELVSEKAQISGSQRTPQVVIETQIAYEAIKSFAARK